MKTNITTRSLGKGQTPRAGGFTLIEILVVIAVMGIIAAMVLQGGQYAAKIKKETAVKAQREKLQTMIDTYQAKLNFYPPDNGRLATNISALTPDLYENLTASNALIYELTGATNINTGQALIFNGSNISLVAGNFPKYFNRTGIGNADASEPQNFFKPAPLAKDYTNFPGSTAGAADALGLLVPAPIVPGKPNFWHYDSSSPKRHNQNSYDLWAEFEVGTKNGKLVVETNGNW